MAGLSALARYSQLTDPPIPVYAVGATQLKKTGIEIPAEVPEPLPGGCQVQVWTYTPTLAGAKSRDKNTVDPLSLSLSLEESTDERIQIALEELREHFPW